MKKHVAAVLTAAFAAATGTAAAQDQITFDGLIWFDRNGNTTKGAGEPVRANVPGVRCSPRPPSRRWRGRTPTRTAVTPSRCPPVPSTGWKRSTCRFDRFVLCGPQPQRCQGRGREGAVAGHDPYTVGDEVEMTFKIINKSEATEEKPSFVLADWGQEFAEVLSVSDNAVQRPGLAVRARPRAAARVPRAGRPAARGGYRGVLRGAPPPVLTT